MMGDYAKFLSIRWQMVLIFYMVWAFVLCISTTTAMPSASCTFSRDQFNSLQLLYNHTRGEDWLWQADEQVDGIPWNFNTAPNVTSNPCVSHWQYLTCSIDCSVATLYLQDINLNGTLPETVFDGLPYLVNLTIATNPALHGHIPSSLLTSSSLNQSLVYLDLSKNSFSGSLPTDFANDLMSLTYLDLSHNGNSPSMDTILYFNVRSNWLSGSLPMDFPKSMRYLDLSDNRFDGSLSSSTLSTWTNLILLNISYNQFQGNLPTTAWNGLSALSVLEISHNGFDGSLPEVLLSSFVLPALTYLNVEFNLFSSQLPAVTQSNSNSNSNSSGFLKILSMNNNAFTGSIPESFSRLTKLELLCLNCSNQLCEPPPQLEY